MNKNSEKLEEQDHPLKNTDHAFVQVGKNGEPVIPNATESSNERGESDEEKSRVVYDKP